MYQLRCVAFIKVVFGRTFLEAKPFSEYRFVCFAEITNRDNAIVDHAGGDHHERGREREREGGIQRSRERDN